MEKKIKKVIVRPYCPATDQAKVLSLELAPETKYELTTLHNKPIGQILAESIDNSNIVKVLEVNGEIHGVAGLVLNGYFGIPWFIHRKKATDYPIAFYRCIKKTIKEFQTVSGGRLTNLIWEQSEKMIAILKRLGFTVSNHEPIKIRGLVLFRYALGF